MSSLVGFRCSGCSPQLILLAGFRQDAISDGVHSRLAKAGVEGQIPFPDENTNRLLRQYFPDGTDLAGFSQAALNDIAHRLNKRPRKTLDFQSPAETLNLAVA